MNTYLTVKTIHILSSTILLGTGLGIAFFLWMAIASGSNQQKYFAARFTVVADFIFTLPAVLIQAVTGFWLVQHAGYDWNSLWLKLAIALYAFIGLCWIPVVRIQLQLRDLLRQSCVMELDLPPRFYQLFKVWFCLGWPAFISVVIVFFLMVFKPH